MKDPKGKPIEDIIKIIGEPNPLEDDDYDYDVEDIQDLEDEEEEDELYF